MRQHPFKNHRNIKISALFFSFIQVKSAYCNESPPHPSYLAPSLVSPAQLVPQTPHMGLLKFGFLNAAAKDNSKDRNLSYQFHVVDYFVESVFKIENFPLRFGLKYEEKITRVDLAIESKDITYPYSNRKSEYFIRGFYPSMIYTYSQNLRLALTAAFKSHRDSESYKQSLTGTYIHFATYKESTLKLSPSFTYEKNQHQFSGIYYPYTQKTSFQGNVAEPRQMELSYIYKDALANYHLLVSNKDWQKIDPNDNNKLEMAFGYQYKVKEKDSLLGFIHYQPSFAKSDIDLSWTNMATAQLSLIYETQFEKEGLFSVLFRHKRGSAWSKSTVNGVENKKEFGLNSNGVEISASHRF